MKISRKLKVVTTLVAVVCITAGATIIKPKPQPYTNLKVLQKKITTKELMGIMTDDFDDGLGVSCGFCHATNAEGHGLDFASDAKPEKEIARAMMRMTLAINKKYMRLKHPQIGDSTLIVSCTTCHKGRPFPYGDEPQ